MDSQPKFRWTLLPTLAAYCVFRLESFAKVKNNKLLRDEIFFRFGMSRSGIDRKINSNFPEAHLRVLGQYSGATHSNNHDVEVVRVFESISIEEIVKLFEGIVNHDLGSYNYFLKDVATEILKKSNQETQMYFELTIAQGLDISDREVEILGKKVLPYINDVDEQVDDEKYSYEVNKIQNINQYTLEQIKALSDKKPNKVSSNQSKYKRNPIIARFAIEIAGYKCEIDSDHSTFNKKTTGLPYLEPHHLIPLSKQDLHDHNLDNLNNIFALCPNCHRTIHFADNVTREKFEEILKLRKKR